MGAVLDVQPSSSGGGSEASKKASLSGGCEMPPQQGNKVDGFESTKELSLVDGKLSCHLCYKMEEKFVHEIYAMRDFAHYTLSWC